MLDKLVLLSPLINRRLVRIALEHGAPAAGYERCIDLRSTGLKLPVRLYYRGRHNQVHKAEIIGVASLGLPRTQEIVEAIYPDLKKVRVYRIDLCVDVLGLSPWFFVINTQLSRRQNFALYRSRGAVSFYLQFSRQCKIVFYDRLKYLRKENSPFADLFAANDQLTRIEVQLMGAAVPFNRFAEIRRYTEIDPLKHLRFAKLRVEPGKSSPARFLAACGFRWLVFKYGQQAVSKLFSPPHWAALQKAHLQPMEKTKVPPLNRLMRRSVLDWLEGKIRFPRAPEPGGEA